MTAHVGPAGKAPDHNRSLEWDDVGQPRFRGCSSIKDFEVLDKLGEGTFGCAAPSVVVDLDEKAVLRTDLFDSEVHKARSRRSGAVVALKKILMHNEKDGFPITALREVKLLKMLSHPNILTLDEMAVGRAKGDGRKKAIMYMVTPYMDHDLSGLLENPSVRFTEPQIKCYMMQLLEGLRYLHEFTAKEILPESNTASRYERHAASSAKRATGLTNRVPAANLLINNNGILQIADFGLARHYDETPPRRGKGNGEAKRDYTTLVVTRWYRPPELLLQLRRYTPAIDMWGVGCVFGEMFVGKPILAGNSDINQAQIIFDLVGSPTEDTMPGWSALPGCEGVKQFKPRPSTIAQRFREQGSSAVSLLTELLRLDWRKRINAIDALDHPYFRSEPLPANPGDLPRFEDSHELDRRRFRGQRAALPPAPAGGTHGAPDPVTGEVVASPTMITLQGMGTMAGSQDLLRIKAIGARPVRMDLQRASPLGQEEVRRICDYLLVHLRQIGEGTRDPMREGNVAHPAVVRQVWWTPMFQLTLAVGMGHALEAMHREGMIGERGAEHAIMTDDEVVVP
ncbi:MAG: serine/threonine protein kinase, CMGC, CDC2/CDK sub [Piccolia ochrophora]|nr:MAG: serine/threonine protein kinase, CMGC, CDC2/CDK sub [Piccolia ochrophora]